MRECRFKDHARDDGNNNKYGIREEMELAGKENVPYIGQGFLPTLVIRPHMFCICGIRIYLNIHAVKSCWDLR